jgi:hypothetical protein
MPLAVLVNHHTASARQQQVSGAAEQKEIDMDLHQWRMGVWMAEERVRLATIEVKNSIRELAVYQEEWLRLRCLPGFEGSQRQRALGAEIQRVRDELTYAKEDVAFAEAHLAKVKASILGGNRG